MQACRRMRCFRSLDFRPSLFQFEAGALDGLVVDRLTGGGVPRQGRLGAAELPAGILELGGQFRSHVRQHVVPARLDVAKLGIEGLLRGLCVPLGLLGVLEHGLELHALALKLVQPVLELHVLRFQQAGGLVHDLLREAQTAGNGHGVAPSGHAHRQVVRRAERVRFEIDAGVHHAAARPRRMRRRCGGAW